MLLNLDIHIPFLENSVEIKIQCKYEKLASAEGSQSCNSSTYDLRWYVFESDIYYTFQKHTITAKNQWMYTKICDTNSNYLASNVL